MSLLSPRTRVAVLRGGPSHEYELSLQSGGHVLSILRNLPDSYEPADILISRDGDWYFSGVKQAPHKALEHADVVFNALHGAYGEDGQVQNILDNLHIPYTGSKRLASALAWNKEMSKHIFEENGLMIPKHEILNKENFDHDKLMHIFRMYLHPVIVKPITSGSAIGLRRAHGLQELHDAIGAALMYSPSVLVEEYIRGKESSCGVLENARGERLHAFMPTGNLSAEQREKVASMAKRAHEALGLRHYSSSDFMITPKGTIYILETDSLPSLASDSVLTTSLNETGWQPKDFVDHVIQLALQK